MKANASRVICRVRFSNSELSVSNDAGEVRIKFAATPEFPKVVAALRKVTTLSVSQISTGVRQQQALHICRLFGLDHDEVEHKFLKLLSTLDQLGATFELTIDGELESRAILHNRLRSWRDIGTEHLSLVDLELGRPSVETLEWLNRGSSPSVFRMSLESLMKQDGPNLDSDALEWIRREMSQS